MATYNLGIIGSGMYGKVLMRWFREDERAHIVWVNSASEETTKSAAEEFGVEKWTLDYREVVADPTVDAVVIATPPYLHAEQLGEIYHIHHNHLERRTFIEWNPKGTWAMNTQLAGGGPFIDRGVYDLSFHLGLLNDLPQLKSLRKFSRNDLRDMSNLVAFSDVEQHGAAWLEFDTGLTYYYERGSGVHIETPNETRIYGTKGGLRFQFSSGDSNEVEFFYTDQGEPSKEVFSIEMSNAPDDSLALMTHFLDCLDGKAEPLMTVQRAAKHMEILLKILE